MTEAPESGSCFSCDVELGSEFYCYGCDEFVCDTCPVGWSVADATPYNTHEHDDHLIDADEIDEEL